MLPGIRVRNNVVRAHVLQLLHFRALGRGDESRIQAQLAPHIFITIVISKLVGLVIVAKVHFGLLTHVAIQMGTPVRVDFVLVSTNPGNTSNR